MTDFTDGVPVPGAVSSGCQRPPLCLRHRILSLLLRATAVLSMAACAAENESNGGPSETPKTAADTPPTDEVAGHGDYISGFLESPLVTLRSGAGDVPNPRIRCTAGNLAARDYLKGELLKLRLAPFGAPGQDDPFVNVAVPPSDDCPSGVANVIGVVEGTLDPPEYVLWVAHYDGIGNEGPDSELGNGPIANVFDNAGAVAVGLQLAQHFMAHPPERSLVIVFSDGEETGLTGFRSWVKQPTLPLEQIKLVIGADPLGGRGVQGSNVLAVIGAEQSGHLQPILEAAFPPDQEDPKVIYVHKQFLNGFTSDVKAVSDGECDNEKLWDYLGRECVGIPNIWLSQLAFQRYHDGFQYKRLQHFFEVLKEADIDLTDQPAYWSYDEKAVFDVDVLRSVYASVKTALTHLLSGEAALGELRFTKPFMFTAGSYSDTDVNNARVALRFLRNALKAGPERTCVQEETAQRLLQVTELLLGQLEDSGLANFVPSALVPTFISVDFFSTKNAPYLHPYVPFPLPAEALCESTPTSDRPNGALGG